MVIKSKGSGCSLELAAGIHAESRDIVHYRARYEVRTRREIGIRLHDRIPDRYLEDVRNTVVPADRDNALLKIVGIMRPVGRAIWKTDLSGALSH